MSSLVEVITAAHLSVYVDSKFNNRGGIMLVAPPSSLKSTIIRQLEAFPNAMVLSDANVQQLMKIRDDVASGYYKTLAFMEVEKLYQRNDATSANVEGHLKGMVEDGFSHSASSDQRMIVRQARCLVVGGMTYSLYKRKFGGWQDDGFARRFLWCHYVLADRQVLMRSIHRWKPIDIAASPIVFGLPSGSRIQFDVTESESADLGRWLKFYKEAETPFILLKKILCVLKWRYEKKKPGLAMEILKDFSECLTKEGAEMVIDMERPK